MKGLHHGFYVNTINRVTSNDDLVHVVCQYGAARYWPTLDRRDVFAHSYRRADERSVLHTMAMPEGVFSPIVVSTPIMRVRGERVLVEGKIQ